MNAALRQLVNNPNAMSLQELQTMMTSEGRDAVLMDELRKVMGKEMAEKVMGLRVPAALPEGRHNVTKFSVKKINQEDFTKVFVWGDRGCGKTGIIGSLLASAGEDSTVEVLSANGEADFRGSVLQKVFNGNDNDNGNGNGNGNGNDNGNDNGKGNEIRYAVLPADANHAERQINVHDVLVRVKSTLVTHRKYPVTLIEAPLTLGVRGGSIARQILDSKGEQIHLLCVDSNGDVQRQGEMFERLLDYLDENKYIKDKTVGVFVVVTKTDMMYRVPRDYRDQAGQTLVTANLRSLWQKVQNICYEKGIFGAVPITFSVGDVLLKNVVKHDNSSAVKLWEDIILPKSQAQRSFLEKILLLGNGGLTAALFIAFICFAGYGLYDELDRDMKPPTAENVLYDYKTEFINKVQAESEGDDDYTEYEKMRKDLDREHKILLRDGSKVLNDSDYSYCDSVLRQATGEISDNRSRSSSLEKTINREVRHASRKLSKALKRIFR